MPEFKLPPLHDAASLSSENAQKRFLWATRLQLASLIVAAVGSVVTLKQGEVEVGAVAALAGFAVALSLRGYLLTTQPAKAWYEGRAAAESVKTLAWRYAIGGRPFEETLSDQDADALFVERCNGVLHELSTLNLGVQSSSSQITDEMGALRAKPLADRRAAYERGRIADQQQWYSEKATFNHKRSGRWQLILAVLEIVGLLAAIARVADLVNIDVLGIAAACSAAATAWLQTRQHEQLAAAYALTAQELANVRGIIAHADTPDTWAAYVQDAEEAISREHTMWKASRGVRLPWS